MIDYGEIMREAITLIAKRAIESAIKNGFGGVNHFFITFATQAKGVVMPEYLRAQNPNELTIVIQHRYWNLTVGEDYFSVDLSFNKQVEHLVIPFSALISFADPSIPIALQISEINQASDEEDEDESSIQSETETGFNPLFSLPNTMPPRGKIAPNKAGKSKISSLVSNPKGNEEPSSKHNDDTGNLVSLDHFRKKK